MSFVLKLRNHRERCGRVERGRRTNYGGGKRCWWDGLSGELWVGGSGLIGGGGFLRGIVG